MAWMFDVADCVGMREVMKARSKYLCIARKYGVSDAQVRRFDFLEGRPVRRLVWGMIGGDTCESTPRGIARVFYAEPLVLKIPRIKVSSFSWVMDRMCEAGILERDIKNDFEQKQKFYHFSLNFVKKSWNFVEEGYRQFWSERPEDREMKFGEGKKSVFRKRWLY